MASFNNFNNAVTEEERLEEEDSCESKYDNCKKNHHDKYIDIDKLCLGLLPEKYREDKIMFCITRIASLTGRIHVPSNPKKTKLDSGKTYNRIYGTGFVQAIRDGKPGSFCPCINCKGFESTKYSILTVTTVNHVVGDNAVAGNATMSLEFSEESLEIYGHKISKTDRDEARNEDWCAVEFVSHELEKVKKLEEILSDLMRVQGELYNKYKDKETNLVVVIGYPHGYKKKVSFGKIVGCKKILKEVRAGQEWCRYEYDAVTCPGSSGSPVFILAQPICGYGYWFGHSHNHSKALRNNEIPQTNASSVGVDKK